MPATSPFEILAGPLEVYIAPFGTAEPDISATLPTGAWVLLGKSGSKNYSEDGVTIRHSQTVETDAFRMLGSTGPRKFARSSEDLEVEFMFHDMRTQQIAYVLNGFAHTVTDTAAGSGIGGNINMPLLRGPTVGQIGVVIRGTNLSAEATAITDSFNAQYWIPNAVMVGEPEVVWSKSAPAGVTMTMRAIEDATNGFGKYRMQDAAAA
jgi:hypothetical protein